MSARVVTVTGEISVDELGNTLAHEHLYCDISPHSGRRDNVVTDVDVATKEMSHFLAAGGRSIIEVTPEGIGRDPVKLRQISEGSGVQIISGISFYDESVYPAWVADASVDTIANYFVRHVQEGVNGVRAGIIGEVASHNEPAPNPNYQLRPAERRVFEAAAKAHRRTGVAITTHAALGRAGHAQLDVLENAGADLSRVAIGHCDAHWHPEEQKDLDYYLPILRRGAFCEFDMIGWTELAPDQVRARRIATLVQMGYETQILLATDTCRRSQLRANGGRGYDFLFRSFLPRLRELSVSEAQIHTMLVDAPRRLLAGEEVNLD